MNRGQRIETDVCFFYLHFYDHEKQTLLETSSLVMDFSQDDKSWKGTVTECVWLSLVALGPVRWLQWCGRDVFSCNEWRFEVFYVALKHSDDSANENILNYYEIFS